MEKKLNVLHIIKSMARGGAEVLLDETNQAHDHNKLSLSYLHFHGAEQNIAKSLRDQSITVHSLGLPKFYHLPLVLYKVIKIIKVNNHDLIHAHLPLSGVIARLAAKFCKIPVVYTEHNVVNSYHPITHILNKITYRLNNSIIAVSNSVGDSIHKHYGISKKRIKVLTNGVNTNKYVNKSVEKNDKDKIQSHIVIGTVVVISEQKRLDIFLEIAAKIIENKKNVRFVIVGDGPLRESLELTCKSKGIDSHVHFAGFQANVKPYLEDMDIFLMTSDYEGLPVSLLEAMSMSIVPVSTNVGGISEVVKDGVNGFLVKKGDKDQLLNKILYLIDNKTELVRLKNEARKTIVERYSIEKMCKDLEKIYLNMKRQRIVQ